MSLNPFASPSSLGDCRIDVEEVEQIHPEARARSYYLAMWKSNLSVCSASAQNVLDESETRNVVNELVLVRYVPVALEREKRFVQPHPIRQMDSHVEHIIDSTIKIYNFCYIEAFGVYFEPGVFAVPEFERTIRADFAQLVSLLPSNALGKLQRDTHIYINKSLTYGTMRCPVVARGCCYHPLGGAEWLKENGLPLERRGCVEICDVEEYLSSCHHWGTGGVLVHEFSHAYHDKFCDNGFGNATIVKAYNVAMGKKLYDNVRVHGPQGLASDGITSITAKAYACTNCMEFFAELSVAYHYALDAHTEYNKWFPFNRAQLKYYDPETFSVIVSMWIPAGSFSL